MTARFLLVAAIAGLALSLHAQQTPPRTWVDKDTGHRVFRLTDEERSDLVSVAGLLVIPDDNVQKALVPPVAGPIDQEVLDEVSTVELAEFKLRAGDLVVLTGEMVRPREQWAEELEGLGLHDSGAEFRDAEGAGSRRLQHGR